MLLEVAKGVEIKILLDRMVQKNPKTGWERRVRLGVQAAGETGGCWLPVMHAGGSRQFMKGRNTENNMS